MFDKSFDIYDHLMLDNDFNITLLGIWMITLLLLAAFCGLFFKKLGRKRATSIAVLFAIYGTIVICLSVVFNWWFAAILCVPFFFLGKFLEKSGWERDIATKRIEGNVKDLLLSNKIIIPCMVLTYLFAQLILYISRFYEIALFE